MKPIPFNALTKFLGLKTESQVLIHGAAIDSRKVVPGDLFFALPGNKVDGHDFIKEASERGAVAAIVKSDYTGETYGLPILQVPDVLSSLQEMAREILKTRQCKVIAITGSLGKTTTKEFAAELIRTQYHVFASPLSYNSQATLPLSILLADGTEDILILEMGMTHQGQIEKLLSIAPPDIAILTTVAIQHAINFSDGLLGIGREKASIFSHSKTTLGFLHKEIPNFEEALKRGVCSKVSFSITDENADYFLQIFPNRVRIFYQKQPLVDLAVSFSVRVHYQNFLVAAALAHSLNIPWSFIQSAIPHLKLPAMRFERVEKKGVIFINDAYNANPDSMIAALESLPTPMSGRKKIAVFSEMDALGVYEEEGHSQVAKKALECVDFLFCLGLRAVWMKKVWEENQRYVSHFDSKEMLIEELKKIVEPGDVVLLKGARIYALDKILESF